MLLTKTPKWCIFVYRKIKCLFFKVFFICDARPKKLSISLSRWANKYGKYDKFND